MARLMNDEAQWIVLMGFIVSFSLFFLAVLINQSTIVGQTTAEAVSEFPKNDIRGVRGVLTESTFLDDESTYRNKTTVQNEIVILALSRQNAIITISSTTIGEYTYTEIHYNNGVIGYNEITTFP